MKIFKNSCIAAGQSNMRRKKSHKHDANLRKNSALYFQIGLILCLLITYGLFEMKFEIKHDDLAKVEYSDTDVEVMPINFAIEKEEKEETVTKKSQVLTKDPIIKDDDYVEMLPTELLTENKTLSKDPVNIDDIVVYKKDDAEDLDLKVFSTLGVERAPVYPGCESEKDNEGRLKCMSDKLSKLVQRKFDRDMASTLGLSGIQKIDVVFKINKLGEVTEIQTRAPRPELESEAKRVVEQIPQMTPGKQRERAVTVQYALPIIFKVE